MYTTCPYISLHQYVCFLIFVLGYDSLTNQSRPVPCLRKVNQLKTTVHGNPELIIHAYTTRVLSHIVKHAIMLGIWGLGMFRVLGYRQSPTFAVTQANALNVDQSSKSDIFYSPQNWGQLRDDLPCFTPIF